MNVFSKNICEIVLQHTLNAHYVYLYFIGTIRLCNKTLRVAMKMILKLRVSMIPVIKTCIYNCPCNTLVMGFMQNANDAKASVIHFFIDLRSHHTVSCGRNMWYKAVER